MSKTTRLYQDARTANAANSNLDKLNDELQDVTRIMTKNMEELLWRGDSLDSTSSYITNDFEHDHAYCFLVEMSHLSTSLRSESEKYRKASRNLNFQYMIRQYAPLAAIGFILLIIIYWKFL